MADPRQRYEDPIEGFNSSFDGRQTELWTALPGIVQSTNFAANPPEMTCTVQPAIQMTKTAKDGSTTLIDLPLLIHVPVCFPGGGGISVTFPLSEGDEVLVVFASRCIDNWWSKGGVQPQAEFRMHDLSDGFCFPRVYSQPNVLGNVSTNSVQIRTDDGKAFIEVKQDYDINVNTQGNVAVTTTHGGNLTANIAGDATVQATNITLTGKVKINGTLEVTSAVTLDSTLQTGSVTVNGGVEASGDGTFGGISSMEHEHEVTAVGSPTSPPLP